MIRVCYLLLFVFTGFGSTIEAANLSSRFLQSTMADSQIIEQGRHAGTVRKSSRFVPFISDGEFRVRNRAWDVQTQRYSLKLEPRGIGETRALTKYNRALEENEVVQNRAIFNEKLLNRYLLIIDLLERKVLDASYRELIILYEDRIRVMEQLKNSTDFDLNDLIEAEKNFSKLTIQSLEETQEVATIYDVIGSVLNLKEFSGFDTSGLITVASIKKNVDTANYDINARNIMLRSLKRQFELAQGRFDYEKAQNRKLISFVEFSYDNGTMIDEMSRRDERRSYDLNQAFILELGIKLPFISGGQDDLARRKIDFLKDEEEYRQAYRDLQQKMRKDTSDIRALITEYEFLSARESLVDAEASLKKYLQMVGVEPLVLLAIKENLVKNTIEKSTVYFSILRNFMYVLDVTGQVSEVPLRNFLYENQENLEP